MAKVERTPIRQVIETMAYTITLSKEEALCLYYALDIADEFLWSDRSMAMLHRHGIPAVDGERATGTIRDALSALTGP